jgi:heme exporter protein A
MNVQKIEARSLGKRYGRKFALFGVDLEIHAGRPCVVMGPNGSGKSTLLSLLTLLKRPTAGSVLHTDEHGQQLDSHQVRQRLGLMTHQPMTYGELTALENIRLFAQLHGLDDTSKRARKALHSVELDVDDPRPSAQFSHGMRRRLALARVLVTDPQVVVLDEPGSGLDKRSLQSLSQVLTSVALKRVLIFTTHDPAFAAELAGHAVFLKSGQLAGQIRQDRFTAEQMAKRYAESIDPPEEQSARRDPAGGQN